MLKKALKVVTMFGVLLAGYAGYVRVFALVTARMQLARKDQLPVPPKTDSRFKREATALARKTFGKDHWSTDGDLSLRLYNVQHGYYVYAREYETEDDGKIVTVRPFALINTRDGKTVQTVTADKARLTLDRPLGLSKPGAEPLRVIRARIEGNVWLRDNKGTFRNPSDDLRVGPLNYVDYDEASLKIRSESDVLIQDQDMRITGVGFLIHLRPKDEGTPGGPGGFNGAETLILKKNVHLVIQDAGQSGVFPGTAKPSQKDGERTPVDLRSEGEMRIDLPRPRAPVRVGPPAPPAPTLAEFSRNVRVLRGKVNATPDQLDCDDLRLTLLPADPAPAPSTAEAGKDKRGQSDAEDESSGGSLSGLTVRRAEATGHAVWLRSMAQESLALCKELIYKKRLPEAPDEIYLRGDLGTQLSVEKIDRIQEGPDRGKIQSVTNIHTVDATIFDDGKGNGNATVKARGPGNLEERPGRDKPVAHIATWQDSLVMLTAEGTDKKIRKWITLTGRPELIDPAQATLVSRGPIVAVFRPKPAKPQANPKTAIASADAPANTGEGLEIEWLEAKDDVHLTSKTESLVARDLLVAKFIPPAEEPAPAGAPAAGNAAAPAPAPAGEQKKAAEPAKPQMKARANRVYAWIALRPNAGRANGAAQGQDARNGDIKEVQLRGDATLHQDPEPGKDYPTDASGGAMNLVSGGKDRWVADLCDQNPMDAPAPSRLPKVVPPAQVSTEGHRITGPRIVFNQLSDEAWVVGPGTLTLMTERGLLTDKADEPRLDANGQRRVHTTLRPKANAKTKTKAKPEKEKVPLTIWWTVEMKFTGKAQDPQGKTVAMAEFFSQNEDSEGHPPAQSSPNDRVTALMQDAMLRCRKMRVYMDRPVTFERRARVVQTARAEGPGVEGDDDPNAKQGAPEPRPEIALIECYRDVSVVSRKVDPQARVVLERQQIDADDVLTYEKASGNFNVRGAGIVYLHKRQGEGDAGMNTIGGAGRPIRPTANPSTPRGRASQTQAPAGAALKPMALTQIKFSKQMKGRFAMGKENDTTEPRWANFFGDIETIHGLVPGTKVGNVLVPDLDFRHDFRDITKLRVDDSFMTAQTMRVISEPPPPGSPENTPARNFLTAWDRVHVIHGDSSIEADKVTYDSQKSVYYAYGDNGRTVAIVRRPGPGQPPMRATGTALRFNPATHESEVIGSDEMLLMDKVGDRPTPPAPPSAPGPKRFRRPAMPSRNDIERRRMTTK